MKNVKVILKFDDYCAQRGYLLHRITGNITPESVIRLLNVADLKANPRESKDSNVTDSIIESIETTPEIHQFKTKGLLIAAGSCEPLERKRFRLSFDDEDLEGILDGGHNVLATARYMLSQVLTESHKKLRSARRWEDLAEIWRENSDEVMLRKNDFKYLLPVEIIFPRNDHEGRQDYEDAILEIAQARNNNSQLTEETKANKSGIYELLKTSMDSSIVDDVEWKTNDGGRVKAREVIALSMVPLLALRDHFEILEKFNPVSLYSNKGMCVKVFSELMKSEGVSSKQKGDIRVVTNDLVKSALAIMGEMPQLYDKIYAQFPAAYNDASSGFGRIRSVRIFKEGAYTKGDKKHLRVPPTTRYYRQVCDYDYPDGFIWPIVYGMTELLEIRDERVVWKKDPEQFIDEELSTLLKVYQGIIGIANYDPQWVGKTAGSYELAKSQIGAILAQS